MGTSPSCSIQVRSPPPPPPPQIIATESLSGRFNPTKAAGTYHLTLFDMGMMAPKLFFDHDSVILQRRELKICEFSESFEHKKKLIFDIITVIFQWIPKTVPHKRKIKLVRTIWSTIPANIQLNVIL